MSEFGRPKSRPNARKHGIDFLQTQDLWRDPYLIEIPAITVDEPRYLVIGRIGAKHWWPSSPTEVRTSGSSPFAAHVLKRSPCMKAKKFDADFDSGKDVTAALDRSKARRPLQEQKRVNVDFPSWMIESLDREAGRLGVTRQSIITVWLAERLAQAASER